MKGSPITHFLPYKSMNDRILQVVLLELAELGQRDVVLGDGVMRDMLNDFTAISAYRKALADAGMRFRGAHAPFGPNDDMDCPYPEYRPLMIERQRQMLEIAASFGVKTITIHVGNSPEKTVTTDQYEAYLFDSLEKLLPTAENLGIIIAIENIWTPTTTAPRLLAAIRRFPTEALGICYDAGHANLTDGRNAVEGNNTHDYFLSRGLEPEYNGRLLKDLLPHVVTCHLHDNNGFRDEHNPPGFGDVDWRRIVPLLKSAPRLQCFQDESSFSREHPLSLRGRVELFRKLIASDGAVVTTRDGAAAGA